MNIVLKTKNLTMTYGIGETAVVALKKTNLEIYQGDFIVVMGPSGSGKSTLLHLLGGLEYPTGGAVYMNKKSIYNLTDSSLTILRRRKFGFIFQYYNLVQELNAYENIILPIILDNRPVDKPYIDEIISYLGLENRLSHLPSALSGGQQQRVAIARALANKPDIILADELTGNLNSKASREVLALLQLLQRKYNQTVVIVTHDINIAESASRLIKLKDGEIISDSGALVHEQTK